MRDDQSHDDRQTAGGHSAEEARGEAELGAQDELAAPLEDAPPVPRDDPELGADGVGAGELP